MRAEDGTWRHVETTVSRYRDPGQPDLVLITARDMSAQVALRRQVTHLTFHDGLTGLPNRAFAEQRAHDVFSEDRNAAAAALAVSVQAARGWCRDGTLAARLVAGRWAIQGWSVAELAARRRKGT